MKKRFSVTVDAELVKWVDAQVSEKSFASRSHALELGLALLKRIRQNERSVLNQIIKEEVRKAESAGDTRRL